MKIIQIALGNWDKGSGANYTLYGLGDDGVVYKSMWKRKSAQHQGWLPLSEEVLPVDFSMPLSAVTDIIPNLGTTDPESGTGQPSDRVIKKLLRKLAAANIQEPDYSAIKKILEEGVDGRYGPPPPPENVPFLKEA